MADLRCPSHPNAFLIEDHRAGDVICPECGLVVGDRIIEVTSEWRSFNNEKSCKDPSRVGAPENNLLSGSDLSTTVAMNPSSGSYDMSALARKSVNSSDRLLIQAFQVIRDMSERIHLPKSIQDQAKAMFKQVHESKQLRGRAIDAVSAACLYTACRKDGAPRTFKEICAVSRAKKKDIGRCFKLMLRILETNLELVTSGDFMSRFCGNLGLPRQVEVAATQIARKAVELDLVAGRSPISVAAASIYMASQGTANDKKAAKEIGEIAGVAEVTIRQSYKLMLPRAADLFPSEFVFGTTVHDLPTM